MFVTLIGKDQFSKDKRIEKFLSETLGDRISDPMAKQVLYATDTNIASISDVIIEARVIPCRCSRLNRSSSYARPKPSRPTT